MKMKTSHYLKRLGLLSVVIFGGICHAAPLAPAPIVADMSQLTHITPDTRNSAKSQSTLLLADNGKALLPVVISAKATDATKAVAKELAEYLKRISGATFEVKTGDGKSGIVLGTLKEFPNPALDKALEIKNIYDGKEAFAIRTAPKRVLLIAATEKGVSHAQSRFLEILGCRWFYSGKVWEVVPKISKLEFDTDETDRPNFLSRVIWFTYPSEIGQDYTEWQRHNRQGESLSVKTGHMWGDLSRLPGFKPEYWAMTGGKRSGENWQICASNAGAQQLLVDYSLAALKNDDMASVGPSDSWGMCECDDCKKLGSVSNQVYGLANIVARAAEKKYPGQGKMVGLYAYHGYNLPPDFDLEPNVHVQFLDHKLSADWLKRSKNRGFYDYYAVYAWEYDQIPGGWGGSTAMGVRHQEEAAINGKSMSGESSYSFGPHGRGFYSNNRVLWNPQVDVNALLADFYEKALGPAAPSMKRYYERVEKANGAVDDAKMGLAYKDIDEASQLAKDLPDVQARLDHLKHY